MKKNLSLFSILFLLVGCTKDKQGDTPQENEVVNHQVKEIIYPHGSQNNPMAYSKKPISMTWENQKVVKTVSKIDSTFIHIIDTNENYIKTQEVGKIRGKVGGEWKKEGTHFLLDGKLTYSVYRYGTTPLKMNGDSIVYRYENERLVNVSDYHFNKSVPKKVEELEIVWENENIHKVIHKVFTNNNGVLIDESIYQYDDKPHQPLGEFAYETPYCKVLEIDAISSTNEFIHYQKLGKWNKNNVILMNKISEPVFDIEYKTIHYERETDKHNRLVKVNMKGENRAMRSEKNLDGTKFNSSIIFNY